jgi:type II secretory pathway pseudopilin PulG
MTERTHGFTVIELIIAIVFLGIVTTLVIIQQGSLAAGSRDDQRKTAINAMYYSLEDVFYKQNGFYPAKINASVLTSMDPTLFTDPNGIKFGESGSDYRYETADCTNNQCKNFTLHASLEKEAEYVKKNRSH